MKAVLFLNFAAAAILAVFATGGKASGVAVQTVGQDVLPFPSLTLEITSAKGNFAPLEPIPITLKLNNETGKRVSGHTDIGFSQNHVELFLVSPEGSVERVEIPKPVSKLLEVGQKVFQPGESYRSIQLITVRSNDILSKPGEYHVQAVIHGANWYEEIKSNFLSVRIVDPEGPNKQALDYIRSKAARSDLFAGFDLSGSPEALDTLEGLSNNFGNSIYGDYASFRLGEFYFYKKEYAKAKAHLDKLAEKRDFTFADKVSDYRDKIKAKQRRP